MLSTLTGKFLKMKLIFKYFYFYKIEISHIVSYKNIYIFIPFMCGVSITLSTFLLDFEYIYMILANIILFEFSDKVLNIDKSDNHHWSFMYCYLPFDFAKIINNRLIIVGLICQLSFGVSIIPLNFTLHNQSQNNYIAGFTIFIPFFIIILLFQNYFHRLQKSIKYIILFFSFSLTLYIQLFVLFR